MDNTTQIAEPVNAPPYESIRLPDDPAVPADIILIKRSTLYYIFFALFLVALSFAAGWISGTTSVQNTNQSIKGAVREAVGTTIADLFTGNQAAQQPATLDPNQRFEVSTDNDPALGPENAPITIVEFSDFQCPFCKRFHEETFTALMKNYEGKVRFVFRDFPLDQIHPLARGAAEAAQCVEEQGKYWEYNELLFKNAPALTQSDLLAYARQLDLDVSALESCITSGKYRQEVQDDYSAAQLLGLTGTPSFFVNGRILVGAQPLAAFSSIIDAELAKLGASTNP